jgi:citrate synthase
MTAKAALEQLRVRPQTLYAYVSRGRIQVQPNPDDPRRSLYSAPDVERLARSSRAVRRPSAVAASTIAWGEPMLTSAVSTILAGRLIYRGVDVVALSREAGLEEAATLLWEASPCVFANVIDDDQPRLGDPSAAALALLARRAAVDPPLLDRGADDLHTEAARLVKGLAGAIAGNSANAGERIHDHLTRSWRAPGAAEPLRRALVLLADHELNVSTFAARVTASSGASLAACLLSGLAALTGPRHGRASLELIRLAYRAEREGVAAALRALSDRNGEMPGFGHPLYAGVDPRAAALLDSFEPPTVYRELRDSLARDHGLAPNIDFALAALAARFGLPNEAPFLIFAIARSTGWIAHALEQARDGALIRPRARYIGLTAASAACDGLILDRGVNVYRPPERAIT